jgi:trans-2,3-dihydro-3-hydroxyanthranilate isomerase
MINASYRHVDVFSKLPFQGNGLVVVLDAEELSQEQMQAVTQEMRQFETVYLSDIDLGRRSALLRIFTEDEELEFAGHPVLGAAAVLHTMVGQGEHAEHWRLTVGPRRIEVLTSSGDGWVEAEMDQGVPQFGPTVSGEQAAALADSLGLAEQQLHPSLPLQVVSTGLEYLIVPVVEGLERARIRVPDFEARLEDVGAKFVYVLDPEVPEGRTWDNAGRVEDVATGSAAGPAAAYLIRHHMHPTGEPVIMHQGRFVARPSTMRVRPEGDGRLWVGGPVASVARGRFETDDRRTRGSPSA